jgi:single-strand DNA-binding protein
MQSNQGVNKIILIGHIDKTPRSHVQTGSNYCTLNFPIITNEVVFKNGGQVIIKELHQIKISGLTTELNAGDFLKDRMVLIEGKIRIRAFTGLDGVKRYKTEIFAKQYKMLG